MINKRRLAVIAVILAAAAAAVLSSAAVGSFFSDTEITSVSFKTGIDYRLERCNGNVLLINNEGIRSMNRTGKEEQSIVFASTSPQVSIKNDYILLADINGKSLGLYKASKPLVKLKAERDISFAALNEKGYIAAATDEPGYKGMITVYDKSGKEIYRWHSGTGYIGGMDLSPRGKLAVLQIMTDKEAVYTKVLEMDIKSKDEAKVLAEIEGPIFDIRFRGNSYVTLVSDSAAYNLKRDGRFKSKIDFGGRVPLTYNIENENNMVFAFEGRLNNTVLEAYSANGENKGVYEAEGGIRDFDVRGESIASANLSEIVLTDSSGKVKKTLKTAHDVKNIKIFPSGDRLLVIGGTGAEIIKLRQ